jgi:hypothetical protein
MITVFVKQPTCALCLLSQSMPRIKSKSYNYNGIRSTLNSNPPIYGFTPLEISSICIFSPRGVLTVTLTPNLLDNICKLFIIL